MDQHIRLFGNRASGHAYKVRLMLALAQLPHEYEEVEPSLARDERPAPFQALARFGEVPLLVHAGRAYAQSNAILLHLAAHSGAFEGEGFEHAEGVREWLFWEADRIGFSLSNLRRGLLDGGSDAGVIAMLRARCEADLARLEAELADARSFILGEAPTIADIALCAWLYWAEQAALTLPPHTQGWLGRIAALPGWRHPDDFYA